MKFSSVGTFLLWPVLIGVVRGDEEQDRLEQACLDAQAALYSNATLAEATEAFQAAVEAVYTLEIAQRQLGIIENEADGGEVVQAQEPETPFCIAQHYTYSCELKLAAKEAAANFETACTEAGGIPETWIDGSFNCFDDEDYRYILHFDSTMTCLPSTGECEHEDLEDAKIIRFTPTADFLGPLWNDADCKIDEWSAGVSSSLGVTSLFAAAIVAVSFLW